MIPGEQNKAIAEWMGYVVSHGGNFDGTHIALGSTVMKMPDFTHDLNAMHFVEKQLTPAQEEDYVHRLGQALMTRAYDDDPRWEQSNLSSFDSTYRATAAQRAEALLRTLNLWRDEPPNR